MLSAICRWRFSLEPSHLCPTSRFQVTTQRPLTNYKSLANSLCLLLTISYNLNWPIFLIDLLPYGGTFFQPGIPFLNLATLLLSASQPDLRDFALLLPTFLCPENPALAIGKLAFYWPMRVITYSYYMKRLFHSMSDVFCFDLFCCFFLSWCAWVWDVGGMWGVGAWVWWERLPYA